MVLQIHFLVVQVVLLVRNLTHFGVHSEIIFINELCYNEVLTEEGNGMQACSLLCYFVVQSPSCYNEVAVYSIG